MKKEMLSAADDRKKLSDDYDEMEEEIRPKDLPKKPESHGRY